MIDPRNLSVGQKVWWNDPDDGFSSGLYEVVNNGLNDGVDRSDWNDAEFADVVVALTNPEGSCPEVYPHELESYIDPRAPHHRTELPLGTTHAEKDL